MDSASSELHKLTACVPFPSPGDHPNPSIKPGSPHCRRILYCLSHQESVLFMKLVSISPHTVWSQVTQQPFIAFLGFLIRHSLLCNPIYASIESLFSWLWFNGQNYAYLFQPYFLPLLLVWLRMWEGRGHMESERKHSEIAFQVTEVSLCACVHATPLSRVQLCATPCSVVCSSVWPHGP